MDGYKGQPKITAGLDLGDKYSYLCLIDTQSGEVIAEGRLRTTPEAFRHRFESERPIRVAIEAGTHSPWASRLLEQCGHEVLVANARKVRLIYVNKRKTVPSFARLTAIVTAETPERMTLTGWPYLYGVTSVPPENAVDLALDAGTSDSPVLAGYRRLAPEDAWDATRGYGWLDNIPQAENQEPEPLRNPSTSVSPQHIDVLQQDFTFDRRQGKLRVAIPAGPHTVYLLTGDAHRPTANMIVSSGGQQLAQTGGTNAAGVFKWTEIELGGGSSGRTVDLRFSAEEDNRLRVMSRRWYLNGLVLTTERSP